MMTLSKPISAGQAQAYHRSEFANAKENYYTEGERVRGEWQGQLATRYGLRGEVNVAWRTHCLVLHSAERLYQKILSAFGNWCFAVSTALSDAQTSALCSHVADRSS
jgi:hypothetical protein